MNSVDFLLLIVEFIGLALVSLGAFFEIVAAIGVLRLPNFYTRVHAATIGAVGGTVLPLIGIAFLAISRHGVDPSSIYLVILCIASAVLILVIAPTGSHVLMRSAYIYEKRREKIEGGRGR